ncbi:MAG: 3-isopropylmalate dehydrogenase [Clostridiales bacterium]|nr:3-isopropylmalate dehydrogenase [Clostridiales bacterium]
MTKTIGLVRGDGIGPEIVSAAIAAMEAAAGASFCYVELPAGGNAIDDFGVPLPERTVEDAKKCDCVLLGAVGGPRWDTLPGHLRPERALLGLRAALGLYANIRPARLFPELIDACPLREQVAKQGFDMVFVRELTGGMYFGERGRREGKYGPEAYDTECYSEFEVRRIARTAFELARTRGRRLISVDKANVLESSRLWREVVHAVAADYPDVQVSDMLVDNAAMQLVKNPAQFDVVVTSNMFGDILSDEASMITGSIGMLPSASLGDGVRGLYEPIHGSAPDIAGRGIANPIATVLSAAMMMRLSLGMADAADRLERAVRRAVADGVRTGDIASPGGAAVGTDEMTAAIIARL